MDMDSQLIDVFVFRLLFEYFLWVGTWLLEHSQLSFGIFKLSPDWTEFLPQFIDFSDKRHVLLQTPQSPSEFLQLNFAHHKNNTLFSHVVVTAGTIYSFISVIYLHDPDVDFLMFLSSSGKPHLESINCSLQVITLTTEYLLNILINTALLHLGTAAHTRFRYSLHLAGLKPCIQV